MMGIEWKISFFLLWLLNWTCESLNSWTRQNYFINDLTFAIYYYIHCAYVLCRCQERHFPKKGERLVMNSKAHICCVVLGRDMKKLLYMLWSNFILGSNFVFFRFWVLWCMIMSLKQFKIKFEPRIKLNYNIYSWTLLLSVDMFMVFSQ